MRDWLITWAQQPLEVRLATVAMLAGGLGLLGLAGPRRVWRIGARRLASGRFLLTTDGGCPIWITGLSEE
jgi:hypothetical protein